MQAIIDRRENKAVVDSFVNFMEGLMQLPIFYPLVSLLIIIDALFPAVPSETVLNLAGAFSASVGVPNIVWLIIVAIVGGVIGDNICFMLGGRLIGYVNRLSPTSRLGSAIVWVKKNMNRRAGATIIVARFLPGARWVATIVLGSVRYSWPAFFFYDTIGVIVWALLGIGVGYVGGSLFSDWPILAMLVGVALGFTVGLLIQRGQNKLFEWLDVHRGVSRV